MKKTKNATNIIRHVIQLASFILFPSLFVLTWNSIGDIYKAILNSTFSFETLKYQILILIAVLPITILWGRFFCGYLCAFGSMQDFVNYIGKKLKIKQVKIDEKNDKIFKYIKYCFLILFVILWTFKVTIDTKMSPWGVFGIYSNYKGWTDFSYLLGLGGFILLLIIISSLFVERIFCKYFCPLGGIFAIISKPRLYKISKNRNNCIQCNICTNSCPMNINVNQETNESGKVKSGECIDCFKCINECPKECLYTNPKETVSATIAPIAISGMYYMGTIATTSNNTQNTESYVEENNNSSNSSNISNNIINSFNMDNNNNANTNNNIINNTNNSNVTNSSSSITSSSSASSTAKFTDGTYTGSGQGYRGTVNVSVKVSDGKITSITIESYKDDEQFFSRAKSTIINEIISEQSIDVDTVTGATFSSNGIISAVANALGISYTNPNSTMQSNIGHGRMH